MDHLTIRAVAPSDVEAVMEAVKRMPIETARPGREGLDSNARQGDHGQVHYASGNACEALRAELLDYLAGRLAADTRP